MKGSNVMLVTTTPSIEGKRITKNGMLMVSASGTAVLAE